MESGGRPAGDTERGFAARRHPTHVHNDMEAIFGIPLALAGSYRTHSADVKTGFTGTTLPRDWLWSPRMWLGLLSLAAILAIGAAVSIWWTAERHGRFSVQLAAPSGERPAMPAASQSAAPPPPAPRVAQPLPQGGAPQPATATVGKVPPAAAILPIAQSGPAKPGVVSPDVKVAETTPPPAVARTDARCSGTGYEHMPTCPAATVLKADTALSAAYASAISANVDPGWLAQYSQHWSQLRQTAAADPDATIDEFANMTSQLNALVIARTHQKK